MLDDLISFYKTSASIISLPKYQSFLKQLEKISLSYILSVDKEKKLSHSCKGLAFINQVINQFPTNIDELKKLSTDIELLSYIDDILEHNITSFGVYAKKHLLQDTFIQSSNIDICNEVILYTINILPLKYYPLSSSIKTISSDIYKIAPLKCISTDTEELSVVSDNGQLIYQYLNPTNTIFILDIKLLLFTWYKYVISKISNKSKENTYSIEEYYIKFIHIPWIFYNQNNWIISIINNTISEVSINDHLSQVILDDLYIDFLDSRFSNLSSYLESFYNELKKKLFEIKSNSLQPQVLLKSYFLLSDPINRFNISSYIEYISDLNVFLDNPQFMWIGILKDYPYIQLLYNLYELYGNTREYKNFLYKLEYLILQCNRTKPWTYIDDIFLKNYVKESIVGKFERIIIHKK